LIELATNATFTPDIYHVYMPVYVFAGVIVALVMGTMFPFFIYILRKDPTIVWRARHLAWRYSFFITSANGIKVLPVMEDDIDPVTKTFDYGDKKGDSTGSYSIRSTDDKGEITEFTHKGHPAHIHIYDQSDPLTVGEAKKRLLEANCSPTAIYKAKDGSIRKQIDSIRVSDPIPKTTIGLWVLAILILVMGVAIYEQSANIMTFLNDHFAKVPSNSTSVCPVGYIRNSLGNCVPQSPPMLLLFGFAIPIRFSFTPVWYRKIGFSKMKAWMLSFMAMSMLVAVPGFYIAKLQYSSEQKQPPDYTVVDLFPPLLFTVGGWIGASRLGDWMFLRSNPWARDYDDLGKARKVFRLMRRQRTDLFWEGVER
jgi:hypothetical protein